MPLDTLQARSKIEIPAGVSDERTLYSLADGITEFADLLRTRDYEPGSMGEYCEDTRETIIGKLGRCVDAASELIQKMSA